MSSGISPTAACTRTDKGRRETNQDRVCAVETRVFGNAAYLLALADGLGGMAEGERAAEIAIETAREFARDVFPALEPSSSLHRTLARMFQEANRRVWSYGRQSGHEDIGTTLVCCLVFGNRYLVAHAGDSRCYYINDDDARLLTSDHSSVQEMVERGAMTREAASRSPFRNQLTNALGEPSQVRVDLVPAGDKYGVIDEPCVLLLSSDGLHGLVNETDLAKWLQATSSLSAACDELMRLADERGSTDNITVAGVECGRLERPAVEQPNVAPTVKLPVSGGRRFERRRPIAGTVAAILLIVAAGMGAMWFLAPRLAPASRVAGLARWATRTVQRFGETLVVSQVRPTSSPGRDRGRAKGSPAETTSSDSGAGANAGAAGAARNTDPEASCGGDELIPLRELAHKLKTGDWEQAYKQLATCASRVPGDPRVGEAWRNAGAMLIQRADRLLGQQDLAGAERLYAAVSANGDPQRKREAEQGLARARKARQKAMKGREVAPPARRGDRSRFGGRPGAHPPSLLRAFSASSLMYGPSSVSLASLTA